MVSTPGAGNPPKAHICDPETCGISYDPDCPLWRQLCRDYLVDPAAPSWKQDVLSAAAAIEEYHRQKLVDQWAVRSRRLMASDLHFFGGLLYLARTEMREWVIELVLDLLADPDVRNALVELAREVLVGEGPDLIRAIITERGGHR
jgi:hypothetical protein